MEDKAVICIDSWTAGAHHFERLVTALKKKGYRLLLIHIGSWGHDKNRPDEELIGDLLVRDIAYYKNKALDEILEQENPAAVIFLSTRAFAHMTFNRYAQDAHVPTCHLYHGLVNVQAVNSGQRSYKINLQAHIKAFMDRAWKNVGHLIPQYVRSLAGTKAPKKAWFDLFYFTYRKALGLGLARPLLDAKTTCGCVYTRADIDHMARNYGLLESDIKVVGNPDLVKFGIKVSDRGVALSNMDFNSREIIYIDTALSKSGYVFDSDDDFVQHLLKTKSDLEKQNFQFAVKLHPAHLKSGDVPSQLERFGITLYSNANFLQRLKCSAAVIVEPSSAAMIPAILGLPLLLANYGKLKGQLYGKILTDYPRAIRLDSVAQVSNNLASERSSFSADQVEFWIDNNIGPLPAEDMPARVAEVVDKMIRGVST